jgi:hypothetical protein
MFPKHSFLLFSQQPLLEVQQPPYAPEGPLPDGAIHAGDPLAATTVRAGGSLADPTVHAEGRGPAPRFD